MSDVFSFAKCWDSADFDIQEYGRVSRRKKWSNLNVVEREMLLYETLYAISTYSPQKVLFKGGTMISRVYITEFTRFSWDLDFEGQGM